MGTAERATKVQVLLANTCPQLAAMQRMNTARFFKGWVLLAHILSVGQWTRAGQSVDALHGLGSGAPSRVNDGVRLPCYFDRTGPWEKNELCNECTMK